MGTYLYLEKSSKKWDNDDYLISMLYISKKNTKDVPNKMLLTMYEYLINVIKAGILLLTLKYLSVFVLLQIAIICYK